jgi:hypothetical protein
MKHINEFEIYTQEMHDELVRVINEGKEYITKLPEEGVVYISSKKIPKREFKRLYPHIKQVTDPSLATFSIVSSVETYFPDTWLSQNIGKPVRGRYTLNSINNGIDHYNDAISGKLMLDKDVRLNNDKEGLTPETAKNIRRLLGSSDLETFKLGFNLLFNHDYEKEKDLFFLCLASANTYCWWKRERTTLSKNIISKIKSDYPNSKF